MEVLLLEARRGSAAACDMGSEGHTTKRSAEEASALKNDAFASANPSDLGMSARMHPSASRDGAVHPSADTTRAVQDRFVVAKHA
jgi:hypothetical protein